MADFLFNEEEQKQPTYEIGTKPLNERIQETEQKQQQHLDNVKKYNIDAPDEIYKQLESLAEFEDGYEDTAEARLLRGTTAWEYSKNLNIPFDEAYRNVPAFNAAVWGDDVFVNNRKSNSKAVKDMFTYGSNNLKIDRLANDLMQAELNNDTELAKGIRSEIEAVEQENMLLQDYSPRNGFVDALKTIVQSTPYTLDVMAAGAIGSIAGASGFAAWAESSYLSRGGMYWNLVKNYDITPQTASKVSSVVGVLEGIAESTVGEASNWLIKSGMTGVGNQLAKTGAKELSEYLGKQFALSNGWKKCIEIVGTGLLSSTGEAAEEGVQEIEEIIGENIAYWLEGKGVPNDNAGEIAKQIIEATKGGFIGSLGFGTLEVGINAGASLYNINQINKSAENTPSKEMFVNDMMKERTDKDGNTYRYSDVFTAKNDEELKNTLGDIWENKRKEVNAQETLRAKEIAEVNPGNEGYEQITTDEETGETDAQPVFREDNKLYAKDVTVTEENGTETKSYRVGDPTQEGNNLYGNIEYTQNGNDINITAFEMADAREGLRGEVFNQFAEDHAGANITWDAKLADAQAIREELINNNPRGKNNGLNYYTSNNNVSLENEIKDTKTRKDLVKKIKNVSKNITEDQAAVAAAIFEIGGKTITGKNLTQYLQDHYTSYMFGTAEDLEQNKNVQAKQKKGATIMGATIFKPSTDFAKAAIYIGEHGDLTTLMHETAHSFREQLKLNPELNKQAEEAFQVQNGDWFAPTFQTVTGKMISPDEAFSYGFEDYLTSGKAQNEQMRNIFQKLAEYFAQLFNALKSHISLNPEIMDVYNNLLQGNDSTLAKAQAALQSIKQEEAEAQFQEDQKAQREQVTEKRQEQQRKEEAKAPAQEIKTVQQEAAENTLALANIPDVIAQEEIDALINGTPLEQTEAIESAAEDAANQEMDIFQMISWESVKEIADQAIKMQLAQQLKNAMELEKSYAKSMRDYSAQQIAERIKAATGWEKINGTWKYETDDSINSIKGTKAFTAMIEKAPNELVAYTIYNEITLGECIEAEELYKMFPWLKDARLEFTVNGDLAASHAELTAEGILINLAKLDRSERNEFGLIGVLSHEIQHLIQANEYAHVVKKGGDYKALYNGLYEASKDLDITGSYDEAQLANIPAAIQNEAEIEARRVARRVAKSWDEKRRSSFQAEGDISQRESIEDIRFQLIGELGATNLDRMEETTVRMDNNKIAKEMEKAGKDAKTIRLATGWEKGVDGMWKYETEDDYKLKNTRATNGKVASYEKQLTEAQRVVDNLNNDETKNIKRKQIADMVKRGVLPEGTTLETQLEEAQAKVDYFKMLLELDTSLDIESALPRLIERGIDPNDIWDIADGESFYLKDLIDNPTLFKAYPELEKYTIAFSRVEGGSMYGYFSPEEKSFTIFPRGASSFNEFKSTLSHEVQHAIQSIEGFATGGSVKQFEKQKVVANPLTPPQLKFIDDVRVYMENVKEEERENFTIKKFLENQVKYDNKDNVYYDDFQKDYIYGATTEEILNNYKNWNEKEAAWLESQKNQKTPYEKYQSLTGEVEARNVQARINMSPTERLNTLIADTMDVVPEQQIIMYDAVKMASVEEEQQLEKTEAERQEEAVRKLYEGTDQWLKAPNGKPSNLNEKQWLQVRTPNFKRWFGNWEYNVDKTVNVTKIDSKNITYDYKDTKAVLDWLKLNLQKKNVIINDDHLTVYLSGRGLGDSLKERGYEQRAAYTGLENILENAIRYDFENNDGKQKHQYLKGQDIYYSAMRLDNKDYSVKIKIDINKRSLNSTFKGYTIKEIKIAPVVSAAGTASSVPSQSGANKYTLGQLSGNVNPLFSKALDENGEPLVVYHGSSQWFTTFNNGKQIQHSGAPANTIFTTTSKEIAQSFIEYYGATPKDVILDENSPKHRKYDWGVYREGGIYSLFVNLKNPKLIDFNGKLWNDSELNINDETKKAIDEGYDGLIVKNIIDVGMTDTIPPATDEYIVFDNTNVKSATDNNGNFDENNEDIRLQEVYHGSSAVFDKFNTEQYGLSGEGSMSFGYGAYVTASEEIARDYAERQFIQKYGTETREGIIKQRKKYLEDDLEDIKQYETAEAYEAETQKLRDMLAEEETEFYKNILQDNIKKRNEEDRLNHFNSLNNRIKSYKEEIETLEKELEEVKANAETAKRHLYTVDIPDSGFIVWDKTVPKSKRMSIMDKLYKKLIKEDYAGAERELRQELIPVFEAPVNGKELYQNIWAYLGGDKETSQFLSSIGIVGVDYPAGTNFGTPDGKEARNYVIFNDEDAKIINRMAFQTLEELYNDAKQFDSWQEFMDFYESFGKPEVTLVPEDADAQYYQTTWELARGLKPESEINEELVQEKAARDGLTEPVKDSLFTSEIANSDTMLDDFILRLGEIMNIDTDHWQAMDAEDEAERNTTAELQDFITTQFNHPIFLSNAKRLMNGNELTAQAKRIMVGLIQAKPRDYRALYAQIMGDETYAVPQEDTVSEQLKTRLTKYHDLVSPNEDIERMSPERRKALWDELDNKEIAQKVKNGTLKMDDELDKYIKHLDGQIKELKNKYTQLEKETQNDYQTIADAERREILRLNEKLQIAKSKYKKSNDEIARKLAKGIKISQKYTRESQNLKANYDELYRKFSDLKATIEINAQVEAALKRQEDIAQVKDDLNAKQKEKNITAEVKKLRIQLVKRTMRRVPFDRIDYEDAKTIIAIQRMLEPNLLGGVNRWIGTEGPFLRGVISGMLTDTDYRESIIRYVEKNAAKSEQGRNFLDKLRNIKSAEDFDNWTMSERKYAIKHLPKENWVKELNLEALAKEREESIDLPIEMVEKQKPVIDEKTGEIKTTKNGEVITQTTWELKVDDEEIVNRVQEAIGLDMYNNLVNVPFADWTTEQLEELAMRVNALYKQGRDILEGKKKAQIEAAAKIRKQIETAVKNTGIVINDDDTPEEKQRKQDKINKILGLNNNIKGTNAAKDLGFKARINRLLHGYNDANVLRVARILDGQKEGVNVAELYRKEDDCYNTKTRSINSRAMNINNVLAANGITLEDLAQKVTVDGREFTVDELLYFAAADKDFVNDEAKIMKGAKADTLAANDDFAATSRNAVMYGNMLSDTESTELKQRLTEADKEMQRKLEEDDLTTEERQSLILKMLDTAPGTTEYIGRCKQRYEEVMKAVNALEPKYKALLEVISNDYSNQYERMNEVSIAEFNTPVHRVKAYVPLVRLESNGDTNVNQVKEDLLATMGGSASKQWVNKGMTQRRVNMSPLNQKPVQTGLYKTWADSVERTEHFIAYAPYVRELNRVYKSRDAQYIRQYIENRYGKGMIKYIDDYINEVANPNANKVREAGAELMHTLRGKTAPAYLAWKASAIIKQGLTSPWPYMQFINPAEYLAASFKCITSRGAMYEAIREKSAFMNNRVFDPMADLIDEMAEKTGNKFTTAINNFNKKGMAGLEWIDWVSVAPGWLACYEKEYARLNGKNTEVYEATKARLQEENLAADIGTSAYKSAEQIEAIAQKAMEDDLEIKAIQYADDCTRQCQPSNRSVDISPLFKNSSEAMKAYLQFQTSLNVIWQNLRYDIPYAIKQQEFSRITGCIIGYVLAGVFMNSVMEGYDDDDDKEALALRQALYYATTQFTDSVPMLGSEITNTMDKLITGKSSFYGTGTDLTPTATKFFAILTNAKKGNWEKAAEMTAEGISMYMGLPVSGAKEIKKLIYDEDGNIGINFDNVYGIVNNIQGDK